MSGAIERRLDVLRSRIEDAARRAGRDSAGIDIVAAVKAASPADVAALIRAGVNHLGENRLQDAVRRLDSPEVVAASADRPGLCRHFIGHCQANKADGVVKRFDRIDSIDSVRLARKVGQVAVSLGRSMPVLIELNVTREATKHGFDTEDFEMLVQAVGEVDSVGGINVVGVMTIGPLEGGPERATAAFAAMAQLRARLAARLPGTSFGVLSMGMSNDFERAIEYGSTEVRIGRALFAPPGN